MPHFTIEYSANLDSKVDMPGLCETIREAALATGLFETGAIRVRAIRCEAYAIADLAPQNAFLDLSVRIGRGRDAGARKAAGDEIFAALKGHLAPLFETPHFALSMDMREADPDFSWKENAMHARLRKAEESGS